MSIKSKKHAANNGSVFRQTQYPLSNAGKLGIFDKEKGIGYMRKDVPESKKRICIIKTDNGRDLVKSWAGHFPNNPDKYRIHLEKEGEIIILIRMDVWQKPANKNIWTDFFKEIVSEYETRKK